MIRKGWMRRFTALFRWIALLAVAPCSLAQQQESQQPLPTPSSAHSGNAPTAKPSDAPSSEASSTEKAKISPAAPSDIRAQSSGPNAPQDENTKRILGFIPNFQSKDDIPQNQEPLTPRDKYILAYHQTVDFSAHIGNAFQAALQQASDGQPHYGQGWGPYAQRFGAAEADQVTSAFFIFGFLPHVLKEDPRYFRKRYGSPWSRIAYAASRTVVTRTDAGGRTFNTPQVLGQLLQQGISTAYYPQQDRSASGVFNNWGINLAYNSAYNVLKEFYPDFLRIVFHRHPLPQAAVTAPPAAPAASSSGTRPANP
jgi:hypothetical protein